MTKIFAFFFFDIVLITSSDIIFLSFDSLGEKYVLLMLKRKVQSFSLYAVS